jgi:5'-3' exonuclease
MQVPGVEADDVIGTLAVNSVSAGYKVTTCTIDLLQLSYPLFIKQTNNLHPTTKLNRHICKRYNLMYFDPFYD